MLTDKQRDRFADALDRLAGDEFVFLKVAEIAKNDAPELVEQSRSSLEKGQLEDADRTIHKLKGLLATFVQTSQPLELDSVMAAAAEEGASAALQQWGEKEVMLNDLLDEINELPPA